MSWMQWYTLQGDVKLCMGPAPVPPDGTVCLVGSDSATLLQAPSPPPPGPLTPLLGSPTHSHCRKGANTVPSRAL